MADDEERECEVMDYQEGSSMENELVTKQNTKSHIWKYLGFEPDESGKPRSKDHPKCRLCKTEIAAKDGNTSNLFSHLKNKHPEEYHRIRNLVGKVEKHQEQSFRQPSLETSWDKRKLLSSSSHEYKEVTKSVIFCLARDILPIATVDKPGFRAMLHKFNPRYKLPSRNHFTKVCIPNLVSETRSMIEKQIAVGNVGCYSATTDLWSSAAGDPYITLTCHAINQQWELKSYCLQTNYLPQDHTAVNIKEVLNETLQLWKLDPGKLMGVTTDSASNVKLACELLNWQRLSCFGHNLNLAISKGLNDSRVECALRVCRALVASFSRSWKKQRDLVLVQEQKRLPVHKLKMDVITRWGSAYDMVERVLEQMEAIRNVLCDDRSASHLIPSWQDNDVLQSIAAALKPLKAMTDALSGEQCVTISAVKPILGHIATQLEDKEDDTELTKEIKERIRVDLELRYINEDIKKLLELTSFLDARFKLAHVDDRGSILKDIEIQMLKELSNEVPTCISTPSGAASSTSGTSDGDNGNNTGLPPSKKPKGLSKILSNCFGNPEVTLTPQQRVKQEIDQYLTHPQLNIEDDPLSWWKLENVRYPILAKLARKYLCLCATSVPAERVFSCGGIIVCDKRTCLKPERVDSLVFLAQNLK